MIVDKRLTLTRGSMSSTIRTLRVIRIVVIGLAGSCL